jgi:hypothetical protein
MTAGPTAERGAPPSHGARASHGAPPPHEASPLPDEASPPPHQASPSPQDLPRATPAQERFARAITALHGRLSYGGLPAAVRGEPLHSRVSDDGQLITLAVRESQLPQRYVRGVYGFRLAEFAARGWVCPALLHRRALFHEPPRPPHPVDDVHVIALERATGKIAGYVCLAASLDAEPLPLDAPGRTRLSVEKDHHIDLLAPRAAPGLNTHQVYEVKRLLRAAALPWGVLAARVPWHVVLGMGEALRALDTPQRPVLLAGDAKEGGSIQHLRLMGIDLEVIEGTSPAVPRTELVWPLFAGQKEQAKPFFGRLSATFGQDLGAIRRALAEVRESESVRALLVGRAATKKVTTS